jgi:hypothetical protein
MNWLVMRGLIEVDTVACAKMPGIWSCRPQRRSRSGKISAPVSRPPYLGPGAIPHRFLDEIAGRLAAQTPKALHMGVKFALAAAGATGLGLACRIHRAAHEGQAVMDRDGIRGDAGIGHTECGGGRSRHAATHDMGVLFGNPMRRTCVDPVVISHSGLS